MTQPETMTREEYNRRFASMKASTDSMSPADVVRTRNDPIEFCRHVMRHERDPNERVELQPFHIDLIRFLTNYGMPEGVPRKKVITGATGCGKAVPLDTEISTANGWSTMGAIQPGDVVYDRFGNPCNVMFCSEIQHGRTLYELKFSDGSTARADAEHQWVAWSAKDRAKHRQPRVVTTEQMAADPTRDSGRRANWHIPVAEAVNYPTKRLPVHPYVLGVWLGNGDSQGAEFTYYEPDKSVVDRCIALEGGHSSNDRPSRSDGTRRVRVGTYTMKERDRSLHARLRLLGVLNNKHVPELYLTASRHQRLELLAGLLDTDGHCQNNGCGRVEITLTNEKLATHALELVRSLGFRASIREGVATIDGRVIGPKWRIGFSPHDAVFHLNRKLIRQQLRGRTMRLNGKTVVAFDKVDSVPVRCIAVDSPDSSYLMGRSYTVTHNTQIAIACSLYNQSRRPAMRIAYGSATDGTAGRMADMHGGYIAGEHPSARAYRESFPYVVKGDTWSKQLGYRIGVDPSLAGAGQQTTVTFTKEPNIVSFGEKVNVLSSRWDQLILDDFVTLDNSLTPHRRKAVIEKFDQEVSTRVEPDGEIWLLCNAFWSDDLAGQCKDKESWAHFEMPVATGDAEAWAKWAHFGGEPPGELNWPDRHSLEYIKEIIIDNATWKRILFCVRRKMGEGNRFGAGIEMALSLGTGYRMLESLPAVPEGGRVGAGVDLAFGKTDGADKNAIVDVLREPSGLKRPLCIETDSPDMRWTADQFFRKLADHRRRFSPTFFVEDNGAQRWIVQIAARGEGLDVRAHNTHAGNKWSPTEGVEALAHAMANGVWALPCGEDKAVYRTGIHPEIEALIEEMQEFDPSGKLHTGDRLMALWMVDAGLRNWLGINRGVTTPGDVIDEMTAEAKAVGPTEEPAPKASASRVATCGDFDDDPMSSLFSSLGITR
jgi:hypothetical protein